MCDIAIGSDTGGSVRVPAALCGIVGFKPTQRRVPIEGAFPLSSTFDSIGPLARSVADCAKADAVIAGEDFAPLAPVALAGLRFGLAGGLPLDKLDDTVATAFDAAIKRLDGAGIRIMREKTSLFDDIAEVNAYGGISQSEGCAVHRDRMKRRAADIDPNVRARIERGFAFSAADYIEMLRARARFARAMDAWLAAFDVLVMPTVPIVAPTIAEVADPKVFAARNVALLRNTSPVNFCDLCAISLPLAASLPVGLMLVARHGHDHRLLRIAAAAAELFRA
jgi:aspartyl-tRNA(Asn)/glutamyl-tRNA(Gln) amidotransferase subunit A